MLGAFFKPAYKPVLALLIFIACNKATPNSRWHYNMLYFTRIPKMLFSPPMTSVKARIEISAGRKVKAEQNISHKEKRKWKPRQKNTYFKYPIYLGLVYLNTVEFSTVHTWLPFTGGINKVMLIVLCAAIAQFSRLYTQREAMEKKDSIWHV